MVEQEITKKIPRSKKLTEHTRISNKKKIRSKPFEAVSEQKSISHLI